MIYHRQQGPAAEHVHRRESGVQELNTLAHRPDDTPPQNTARDHAPGGQISGFNAPYPDNNAHDIGQRRQAAGGVRTELAEGFLLNTVACDGMTERLPVLFKTPASMTGAQVFGTANTVD